MNALVHGTDVENEHFEFFTHDPCSAYGLLADGTDVVGAVGAFLPGGRKFKVIQWCDFGLGGLLFGGWLVIGISSHREGVVGSKSSSKMF